jgi:hypothetical protein
MSISGKNMKRKEKKEENVKEKGRRQSIKRKLKFKCKKCKRGKIKPKGVCEE